MSKTKIEKPKIETRKHCVSALKEIKGKTDWSLRGIAEHMGVNYETLRKVEKGYTKNPGKPLKAAIAEMLAYARAMP